WEARWAKGPSETAPIAERLRASIDVRERLAVVPAAEIKPLLLIDAVPEHADATVAHRAKDAAAVLRASGALPVSAAPTPHLLVGLVLAAGHVVRAAAGVVGAVGVASAVVGGGGAGGHAERPGPAHVVANISGPHVLDHDGEGRPIRAG